MAVRLVLQDELIEGAALRAAVERQCRSAPDLLPKDPADEAVIGAGRFGAVARSIHAEASSGLSFGPRASIAALKSRLVTRPVAPLSLSERSLLDHLVELLRAQLDEQDLTDEVTSLPYKQFTQAPVKAASRWVVGADVNSYYQYIDHAALTDEVVGRTGEWSVARTIRDILGGVMDMPVGLPQGFRPARLLADVYMATCIRRLRREGFATWCHSDDLRIGVPSKLKAHEALQILESSMRELGLSLNTEKCWIRERAVYAEWEQRPDQLLAQFSETQELEIDLWRVSEYPEEEHGDDDAAVESPDAEAEAQRVRRTVQRVFEWTETREETHGGALEWSHRRVITEALRKGRTYGEPAGVPHLARLIGEFPQLTPEISRYLHAMGPQDEAEARHSLHEMCDGSNFVSPWQLAWLGWASSSFTVSKRFLNRCEAALSGDLSNEISDAWAGSVLCTYGARSPQDLSSALSSTASPIARNILLRAIAVQAPPLARKRRDALASDSVERAVVDFFWSGE